MKTTEDAKTCLNDSKIPLTIARRHVWGLIALGYDNSEIVTIQKSSESNVRKLVMKIYEVFGIKGRNQRVKLVNLYWSKYGDPKALYETWPHLERSP